MPSSNVLGICVVAVIDAGRVRVEGGRVVISGVVVVLVVVSDGVAEVFSDVGVEGAATGDVGVLEVWKVLEVGNSGDEVDDDEDAVVGVGVVAGVVRTGG
jgi:hypothetical protein